MSKLVLWGAGGHAKVVLDIALALNRFSAVEFIDEDAARAGEIWGCRVLGSPEIACLTARDGDVGDFDRIESRPRPLRRYSQKPRLAARDTDSSHGGFPVRQYRRGYRCHAATVVNAGAEMARTRSSIPRPW
jgi:hypothetical protein